MSLFSVTDKETLEETITQLEFAKQEALTLSLQLENAFRSQLLYISAVTDGLTMTEPF